MNNMNRKSLILFWKVVLALSIILTVLSLIQRVQVARDYNINIFHSIWIFLLSILAVIIILLTILFILFFTKWKDRLIVIPELLTHLLERWKGFTICIFIALLPVYSFVTLHPYLGHFYANGSWTLLALFWWISIGSMICIKAIREEFSWFTTLWLAALISVVVYTVVRQFVTITNYPFALTWSEAARFYGASLFFSKQIYGVKIPLGIMHATWHFLLAFPFLFGNLPIWIQRLWWVLLKLGLGIAVSRTFANLLKLGNRSTTWVVAGWAFIFLFSLPLLVQLQFCTFLILWGVKPKKTWRTTIIVVLASIWAGLSRINWFPVPGIFAAILYLLEVPYKEYGNGLRYLWKPICWIMGGTLVALVSNLVYMQLSGNGEGGNFLSSLTSALLWYRLLPNPTYHYGILLNLLILAGPVIGVVILSLRYWHNALHPLRLMGIAVALIILLAGGVVVSVKIGGGSDLHNLDAFLILLIIVGGYFFFGSYVPELLGTKRVVLQHPLILSLLLMAPIWMIIRTNTEIFVWDKAQTDQALNLIRQNVEDISRQGGQVLFISQRQLLALKMVNIPLIPDFEQDFLMEMVMSHNQAYLETFHEELRMQRFAAIVIDAQNVHFYGRTSAFGEENDLWVQEVSIPLLCYYEVPPAFSGLSTVVYLPRTQPCK